MSNNTIVILMYFCCFALQYPHRQMYSLPYPVQMKRAPQIQEKIITGKNHYKSTALNLD